MLIFFERSGGFAGRTMTVEFDTTSLPPDEVEKIHQMVEEADFFHLPASLPPPAASADVFEYVVTIEEQGKRHTVRTAHMTAPDALRRLLEYLTQVARAKRGG
jgi:hypothetical protein